MKKTQIRFKIEKLQQKNSVSIIWAKVAELIRNLFDEMERRFNLIDY